MSMIGGRQTIRFAIPDYSAAYAGYLTDSADLIERDGRWWLHVVVTVPAPDVAPTDQVVGSIWVSCGPPSRATIAFWASRLPVNHPIVSDPTLRCSG